VYEVDSLRARCGHMSLVTSYLVVGGGLVLSALLLSFALRLWRVNKIEATKGAARSRSIREAILGRARMDEDWIPDARIKGGLVYNKKKKRLEISGRLSDDSFKRVFD
jgi:hypothetical protein